MEAASGVEHRWVLRTELAGFEKAEDLLDQLPVTPIDDEVQALTCSTRQGLRDDRRASSGRCQALSPVR